MENFSKAVMTGFALLSTLFLTCSSAYPQRMVVKTSVLVSVVPGKEVFSTVWGLWKGQHS